MLRKKWLLRTIIAGCAASCAQTVFAADTLVRQFNAGDSAAAVGIAPAVEDVELTGPQALTSDADGNLFVLDQINGRILRFDPKQPGGDPSVLKMPADVQPNDLIVRKSDILVWDGSIRTLKAANEPSTRGVGGGEIQLEEVGTRGVDDPIAVSAFAQMGSQPPGSAAELLDQNTRAAVVTKGRQRERQYIASQYDAAASVFIGTRHHRIARLHGIGFRRSQHAGVRGAIQKIRPELRGTGVVLT